MIMANKHVTLKAELGRGHFYWVCDVEADSDDEAIVAAENLFQSQLEKMGEWEFSDFNVDDT